MRRAVVAGGAGFIGSHLVELLVARERDVTVVDDLSTGRRQNLSAVTDRVRFVHADICDPRALEAALPPDGAGIDEFYNLASPASPADYHRLPVHTLRSGSVGVQNTLEFARRVGAGYLYASTSEIYGDPLVHPQPESYTGNVDTQGPRSVYDEAKRFGESMVATYRREYALDTKIVRLFNTFGPRMRFDDGRAIPNFVHQSLTGLPVTVAGDGSQTRSICFVDDLVRGIVAMMESGSAGPINLGNPEEISMLDLARWVIELTESDSLIEFVERPRDDPQVRRPDIARAASELGWAPSTTAEIGLKATIEAFREQIRSAARRSVR